MTTTFQSEHDLRTTADRVIERVAREIALRAERRLGELSKVLPRRQGLRNDLLLSKEAALDEVGLSKMQASRAESLADIPEGEDDE